MYLIHLIGIVVLVITLILLIKNSVNIKQFILTEFYGLDGLLVLFLGIVFWPFTILAFIGIFLILFSIKLLYLIFLRSCSWVHSLFIK